MNVTTLGKVHLARHAEGLHNLRRDPNIEDAPLTQRAFYKAQDLGHRILDQQTDNIGAIITSPLQRAIQTCLYAFEQVLDQNLYRTNSSKGIQNGVGLYLDPDLQELSDMPCNTGSTKGVLISKFPNLETQIRSLDDTWYEKRGHLDPNDATAVRARRDRILKNIYDQLTKLKNTASTLDEHDIAKNRIDVVVVAHEGIIGKIAPGPSPLTAEFKTLTLVVEQDGKLALQ